MKRIGFLGGAFNPIHTGHIQLARNAYNIAELDLVYLVPTFSAPHKDMKSMTPYEIRCSIIQSTIEKEKGIELSIAESLLPEPSFTYRTKDYFTTIFPDTELFFICGSIDFITIDTWHEGVEFLQNTNTIIAPRNNCTYTEVLNYISQFTTILDIIETPKSIQISTKNAQYIYMSIPSIPISSTELRKIS